jgi:hypothetical protein
MRFTNDAILSVTGTSGTTVTTGTLAQDTSNIFAGSVQVISTGAMGTLKLQASNDKNSPVNWSDISGASVSVTGSGAFLIPKLDLCYRYIRAIYTNSSGSGDITANFEGMGY